ncbi:beta-D-glucosyl crocetin beta-1,6-glucosyltransferase-like [Heracleum sosnowskyi]|uniref:Beta-D-glucosyl crocetin beta-1,6-glucosyltransferase-like n=1 Tax=Heracleum sosnowskyi TaxID=360622 RepID=A0AAD8GLQ3_9APIA|nr:beta-D-glucosyl crocetin beta-1,6-glucosyltransferase-like [Heracleum sosnowskyi]
MGNRETGITVLMLPWLGHGHISPFLELGKRFARKGLSIYLCSTPVNLRSVKQTLENNPFIKTVELHLPNLPDLPPHYHTTKGLPPNLLSTLNKAYDMAAPNFSNIVQNLKPDLLIYDFIQFWAPQVALSQNIPSVFFITTGAATSSYIIHKHVNPNTPFPFPAIYCKGYEKEKYEHCAKVNPYVKIIERIVSCARQSHEIFEWLDKKDKASTVFVSFGSECFLSKEEMEEIACGLEISCVNFLWVVRSPFGEKCLGESLKELRERIGEKGKILDTWAPQGRILGHPSIGGFVSHCGWGSVMEAVTFGIPIIAIPMQYDQPLNARVVQEAGLGEEVKRGRNGRLQMGEIAKVVRKMVLDEDGDEVRRKTKYLSESIRDRGDNKDFDMVVKELTKLCNI